MRNTGKFGRRKSDWFLPIGLALIIGLAMGWALDSRTKNEEIARLNDSLERALQVSPRALSTLEPPSRATPAPRPSLTPGAIALPNTAQPNTPATPPPPTINRP
jgi:hypothetical protein